METYQPPFSITNRMLMLTAEIAEKTGLISGYHGFTTKPHLRRNNRIRSVYASVAIEANSLSLEEVRSVIDGKTVIGPWKEIQEVRNAYQAYDMIGYFNPYSQNDLKKIHGIMTGGIEADSGSYRNHEEGVFHGDTCIFIAPPHRMVPDHMNNLFEWLNYARETIHPLILSSVFHYEFVFIHPFSDGNGRMARLWQTALLSDWNLIFQYLPLESHIHEFQEAYYDAISACHAEGNSDKFILFMLERINITMDRALQQISAGNVNLPKTVQKLLGIMEYDEPYTTEELLSLLGMKSKVSLRKNYLVPALENGLIAMTDPDHPTSRNQAYIRRR